MWQEINKKAKSTEMFNVKTQSEGGGGGGVGHGRHLARSSEPGNESSAILAIPRNH